MSRDVKISPKDAIAAAKRSFFEFYAEEKIENVLLEELVFDEVDGVWNVTIGFDVGRTKIQQPSQNALAMFGQQTLTPIREARKFILAAVDGTFIRMEEA